RRLLTEEQKRLYAKVAQYCNRSTDLIPMSFVLGFYVTLIVNRWWAQYTSIPLPDQLMCVISSNVHGKDEKGRILRRTLIRYANLSAVLILRSVSTRVLKRFPTMDHVVEAGEELNPGGDGLQCGVRAGVTDVSLSLGVLGDVHIRDDVALCLLMDELNLFRAKCSTLFHYDWISIPLVYTQVGTHAPHQPPEPRSLLFPPHNSRGAQSLLPPLDMYVPLSTLLQFFFYAGWLKVAEQIINPFGEDDDDFETNKLIDRNLQ
ncbi:Bestrophin-4, partial [Podiceps cristatus]